jgi:hypothetical protein
VLGVLLAGCGEQELEVTGAWARPGIQGGNTAIYFDIDNPAGEADTLLAAEADIAAAVELHLSMMVSPEEAAAMGSGEGMTNENKDPEIAIDENEGTPTDSLENENSNSMGDDMVMVMQQQNSVAIPAGGITQFRPGGLHVMVISLNEDLLEGATFPLTLVFENAGEIDLDVPVQMPTN